MSQIYRRGLVRPGKERTVHDAVRAVCAACGERSQHTGRKHRLVLGLDVEFK